ncbi:MAG: hypothetical protein ACM3JH_13935 [Acidithiobacillales bacterium]
MRPKGRFASRRPLAAALLLTAGIFAATADERVFGLLTDGQIRARTAYSIVELGELGMARGRPVNVPRPAGDAVTLFGIGPTLVRVVPMSLAGPWEGAFDVGSFQTLFVLVNVLMILAAAALPALVFGVLFVLGLGVNLLGALQPDSATNWYYFTPPNRPLPPGQYGRWPDFATGVNLRTGQPENLFSEWPATLREVDLLGVPGLGPGGSG